MHKSTCSVVFFGVYWGTTYYVGVDAVDGPKIRRRAQYEPA